MGDEKTRRIDTTSALTATTVSRTPPTSPTASTPQVNVIPSPYVHIYVYAYTTSIIFISVCSLSNPNPTTGNARLLQSAGPCAITTYRCHDPHLKMPQAGCADGSQAEARCDILTTSDRRSSRRVSSGYPRVNPPKHICTHTPPLSHPTPVAVFMIS